MHPQDLHQPAVSHSPQNKTNFNFGQQSSPSMKLLSYNVNRCRGMVHIYCATRMSSPGHIARNGLAIDEAAAAGGGGDRSMDRWRVVLSAHHPPS